MTELTLPLAWFNWLPVVFGAVALVLTARLIGRADPAWLRMAGLGAGLVIAGGTTKAVWKLMVAGWGLDVPWLAQALFPLLAPGFALLAGASLVLLRRSERSLSPPPWTALGALLLAVALSAAARTFLWEIPRGWFLPLLLTASLANLALSGVLIACALRLRQMAAALAIGANLLLSFALPPIALAGAHSLALHWLEQSLTAAGAAAFAWGAWRLWAVGRPEPIAAAGR